MATWETEKQRYPRLKGLSALGAGPSNNTLASPSGSLYQVHTGGSPPHRKHMPEQIASRGADKLRPPRQRYLKGKKCKCMVAGGPTPYRRGGARLSPIRLGVRRKPGRLGSIVLTIFRSSSGSLQFLPSSLPALLASSGSQAECGDDVGIYRPASRIFCRMRCVDPHVLRARRSEPPPAFVCILGSSSRIQTKALPAASIPYAYRVWIDNSRQCYQQLIPRHFPTLHLHAYNRPASVAGVFRETFAGRREPAPCARL